MLPARIPSCTTQTNSSIQFVPMLPCFPCSLPAFPHVPLRQTLVFMISPLFWKVGDKTLLGEKFKYFPFLGFSTSHCHELFSLFSSTAKKRGPQWVGESLLAAPPPPLLLRWSRVYSCLQGSEDWLVWPFPQSSLTALSALITLITQNLEPQIMQKLLDCMRPPSTPKWKFPSPSADIPWSNMRFALNKLHVHLLHYHKISNRQAGSQPTWGQSIRDFTVVFWQFLRLVPTTTTSCFCSALRAARTLP